jgi:hypothetical protein
MSGFTMDTEDYSREANCDFVSASIVSQQVEARAPGIRSSAADRLHQDCHLLTYSNSLIQNQGVQQL